MVRVLTDLADAVSRRVDDALTEWTAPFEPVGDALPDLLAPARALLIGGKRLRPRLCAAGWLAAGETLPTSDCVIRAGSALELFQAAALVHDDVMDGSATRRGMPAAHRRFTAEHEERAWAGDPGAYGVAGAIVLGDLLLAVSATEMEAAATSAGPLAGRDAHRVYDRMTAEVAVGQYLDVRAQALPWSEAEAGPTGAVERAMQVVRHKSARYSVEHPLVLGAALAGADAELMGALQAVGLPLGEAFQLRDDVLGVFGDPEVTGKPAGDDLREGKRTVLLAMTVDRADPEGRTPSRERVGAEDLHERDVARLQELMRATGALEAHEELIGERYAAGLRALDAADLPDPAVRALRELASAVVRRSA